MLHIQPQNGWTHVVPTRKDDPGTYVFHPLAGLRFFRRLIGGRWERWVMHPESAAREGCSFWVRTGDAVHTPHLLPTPNITVQQVESWPKSRIH